MAYNCAWLRGSERPLSDPTEGASDPTEGASDPRARDGGSE